MIFRLLSGKSNAKSNLFGLNKFIGSNIWKSRERINFRMSQGFGVSLPVLAMPFTLGWFPS